MKLAPPPHWTVFPDVERHSIHWRMGAGETAYIAFYDWFEALSDAEAQEYVNNNPAPEEWADWYQRVRTNNWDE